MSTFHSVLKAVSSSTYSALLSALLALTLIIGLWANSAQATAYYVSTVGSDSNVGTLALPFRTIQKAASLMRAGDTCLIRGGTYRETVTPTNSGKSDAPITFEPYLNEVVVISGADIVSGFAQHSGDMYRAVMPSMGKGMDQVFMSGAGQPEARFPDKASPGLEYPAPLPGALWPPRGVFSVPNSTQITSALLNNQPPGMWNGALYMGTHYASYQFQKADITNSASGVLTVIPLPGKWYVPPFYDPEHGRGFISGVMNAITVQGEWIWQNGTLYIQTPHGQTPSSTTIEAKARQLAFNLTGKSYINIKKLEVFSAGLTMYNGSNNTIDGAKFSYIHQRDRPANGAGPNDSLRSLSGIYLGGHHNTIKNSIIAYSSGSCVTLLGLNHTLINNVIHDCGYGGAGAAVHLEIDPTVESGLTPRGGHIISHNTLYNAPGPVIAMSRHILYFLETGRSHVPYHKTGLPTPYLKNMITYNEIYNPGLLLLDIGSHFYTHGTDGGGTEIAYNVIHDQHEPGSRGCGVYLDEGSYNFNTHHNLLWMGREGGTRAAFSANLPGGKIMTSNSPVPLTYNAGLSIAPYPQSLTRIFANNTYKYDYHGGVADLTDADFPNGQRFAFGANLNTTTTTTSPP